MDRPEIVDCWGLGDPGGRENPYKWWCAKQPYLLEGVSRPPGPPRPQEYGISGRPQNLVLKTLVKEYDTTMSRRAAMIMSMTTGYVSVYGLATV